MKQGLKEYICEWEDQLNISLIDKTADEPLVNYIVDAWKSLEVVKQIKFIGYDYTEKESEIDINKYIFKREKKKRKKDRYDIKAIDDDRVGKLTVYLEITMLETDQTTGETTYQCYPVKKSMLIPLQDEEGYFTLKGKKYYMIYQMVEKSTYTSASNVTLKSLMPVAMKRTIVECKDVNEVRYSVPCYYVFIFKKEVPVILFYLSRGVDYALDYLNVSNVVTFIDKMSINANHEEYLFFPLSTKCILQVDKDAFYKYPFVQSIVGAFETVCTNRVSLESLRDPKEWIKRIVNPPNYEKGYSTLKYSKRLLDETTKKKLKVPEYYSQDIYSVMKWMMQHFNELRLKDNCDLGTKRLRCFEYIESLLNKEFSRRVNRIISLGDKATIDNIKEIFKFPGDILISKMHSSGVLRFDDNVNDMNFWSKLKFTNKGPHSLGNGNSNNISVKYRDIHPSMLGQVDILVCGNSDPGTSGLLSPFANIDGLYFDPSDEPSGFYYSLMNDIREKYKDKNISFITCEFDNQDEFYKALRDMDKYTSENVNISGTSREGVYEIIINEKSDMDDQTKPQTVALAKKKKSKDKGCMGMVSSEEG